MTFPRLPRWRQCNWKLWWTEHKWSIIFVAVLQAVLSAAVLGLYIYYKTDGRIRVGQPVITTPLAEMISAHDAEFEQAMLEIIERDDRVEKERRDEVIHSR